LANQAIEWCPRPKAGKINAEVWVPASRCGGSGAARRGTGSGKSPNVAKCASSRPQPLNAQNDLCFRVWEKAPRWHVQPVEICAFDSVTRDESAVDNMNGRDTEMAIAKVKRSNDSRMCGR